MEYAIGVALFIAILLAIVGVPIPIAICIVIFGLCAIITFLYMGVLVKSLWSKNDKPVETLDAKDGCGLAIIVSAMLMVVAFVIYVIRYNPECGQSVGALRATPLRTARIPFRARFGDVYMANHVRL